MKNIILITVDCLREDHSAPVREAIDQVLGPGIVFESAYATGPATPFAFLGILGSKLIGFPDEEIAFVRKGRELTMQHKSYHPHKRTLLAEVLKKYGYATYGIMNNPYIYSSMGYGAGLDKTLDYFSLADARRHELAARLRERQRLVYDIVRPVYQGWLTFRRWVLREPEVAEEAYHPAGKITRFAKELVRSSDKPIFLHIHYMDAHAPFLQESYAGTPVAPGQVAQANRLLREYIQGTRESLSEEELSAFRQVYRYGIAFVARHIQDLLQDFQSKGLLKESLVILTADHGELLNEHGRMTHAYPIRSSEEMLVLLCEKLVHVPLVLYGMGKGKVSKPVSMVDLPPTVLDIIGGKAPPEWFGQTMFSQEERPVVSEVRGLGCLCYAIRTREWYYAYNESTKQEQLYMRRNGEDEGKECGAEHPDVLEQMRPLLAAHQKRKAEKWQAYLQKDLLKLKRDPRIGLK